MNDKIENIVIENQQRIINFSEKIDELSKKINELSGREDHVKEEINKLEKKIKGYKFNRDNYKEIDNILKLNSLGTELLVYEKLGYKIPFVEYHFVLGLFEMTNNRSEEASEHFESYLDEADERNDEKYCDVLYLCGIIHYNGGNFHNAIEYFERSADMHLSLSGKHDYQAEIYMGECMFLEEPQNKKKIEGQFQKVKEILDESNVKEKELDKHYMTLYLKWGNLYFHPI